MGINSKIENKAVFLDRDGVINKAIVIDGKPYPPSTIKEVEILPGVQDGISLLKWNGYKIFVITNQPDVARVNCFNSKRAINKLFSCRTIKH